MHVIISLVSATKVWYQSNGESSGSIADVRGTNAIEALIAASFANQAVDSIAEVAVAELV